MRKNDSNKMSLILLLSYTLLLSYWMLWGFGRKPQLHYMYNLIPFHTIKDFLQTNNYQLKSRLINLIGNIVVFAPFGILIPSSFGGKYFRMLGIFLMGLITLETLQLVTRRGSLDVDDFILNSIGAMVGYGFYALAKEGLVISRKSCR